MLKWAAARWLVLASVGLVLLGGASILLLYGQLSRVSQLDVLHSFQQAVEQTAINLNDRMAFAEDTLRSVLFDARMQASVTRPEVEETLEVQLKEIKDLREMVYRVEKGGDVTLVRMYLNEAKMITRERINFFPLPLAEEAPEYARVYDGKGALVWIGAHTVCTPYFQGECLTLGCLYRTHFSPDSRNRALVLLDLSTDAYAGLLGALELPDESAHIAVTDGTGTVMFGTGDPKALGHILSLDAPYGFYQPPEGSQAAYITKPLASADWHITVTMPRESLLNLRQPLRRTLTLLLFGLTLLMITLVGCIIYALYSHNVRKYIRTLNDGLKAVEGPDLPPPIAHRALFDLDRNIAELLETNRRLTEENYRAQLREREVTLQALQAQINPHFLYNTLDSIHWMAIREGAPTVSDAVATLAEYFRLSLSRGRSIVTLREDIEIARKYLTLYRHRFDHAFTVQWDASEEALDCLIPKLTLQPLIENALQHGIFRRSAKEGGHIAVTAQIEGETMVVAIRDNGPGLAQPESPHKGYGLTNVRERLELYFGGKHTIDIVNLSQGGAQVTVRVTAERGSP